MNCAYLKLFVDCLEKYQKLNDTEFGRLVRAALRYKATGEESDNMGREALLWDGMRLDIDRDNDTYAKKIAAKSDAGKKGAMARWQSNGKNSKCHLPYGKNSQDKEKEKDKEKEEDKGKKRDANASQKEIDLFFDFSCGDSELLEALKSFEDMRRRIKKPLTDHAKGILLSKLQKIGANRSEWIEILNQSVLNCWQGVFPLRQDKQEMRGLAKTGRNATWSEIAEELEAELHDHS